MQDLTLSFQNARLDPFFPSFLKSYEGELSEVPLKQRRKPAKTLDEYQKMSGNRNNAIVEAYQSGGYTMEAIANYFGCHYSTVSRVIAKFKT